MVCMIWYVLCRAVRTLTLQMSVKEDHIRKRKERESKVGLKRFSF